MGKLGTIELSRSIGGNEIRFETGKVAGQAHGAVVASLGNTVLLCTSTASSRPKEHLDFFPLTVDYEERMYAAGKIPGSFFKREGRPSEQAILTARLIDRPMRPTFNDGLRNEIQILITTLAADQVHAPDVLAINGASLATLLAGIPFDGPVAGLRMGLDRDGRWHPFPTFEFLDTEAVFDLVVAGRLNPETDEIDILMVEAEATEHAGRLIEQGAQEPTEDILAQALQDSKRYLKELAQLQRDFAEQAGTRSAENYPLFPPYQDAVYGAVERAVAGALRDVLADASLDKASRNQRISDLREEAVDAAFQDAGDVEVSDEELERQARSAFKSVEKKLIRQRVVNDGVRIDGRGPKDLRALSSEVDVLPVAHGSGLFKRGETQVLTILTLGMLREAQRLDTLTPEEEKRYIHHYNFPPYSVGETGFMRGPKRREIGHGALAERALLPVIPDKETFPYTIRLVSEVLSSNGSTSMGSVCGSTLALMDAGVPIANPVGGIAMGLISEDGKFTTLTDILGAEDAFGDMDFKVAGTKDFVTALQLDTKLSGIPADVLGQALAQAREARMQILESITTCMPGPRPELNPNAPRVLIEYIPGDKIGEVIGPKGKIIREITEQTGADINIEDVEGRGVVHIYSPDADKAQMALDRIRAIANPVVPKEGERYYGTVVKTADFGAFVSLTPGSDGLLHISKLPRPEGKRLNHADEAVEVGQKMWVEVVEVREGRKFALAPVEGPEGAPAPSGPAARDEGQSQGQSQGESRGDGESGRGPRTEQRVRAGAGGEARDRGERREGREGGEGRERTRERAPSAQGEGEGEGEGETRRRRRTRRP